RTAHAINHEKTTPNHLYPSARHAVSSPALTDIDFSLSAKASTDERMATTTPARAPPATRPVANKLPLPRSSSSGDTVMLSFFCLRSTSPLIAPPMKMGSVVDKGR